MTWPSSGNKMAAAEPSEGPDGSLRAPLRFRAGREMSIARSFSERFLSQAVDGAGIGGGFRNAFPESASGPVCAACIHLGAVRDPRR